MCLCHAGSFSLMKFFGRKTTDFRTSAAPAAMFAPARRHCAQRIASASIPASDSIPTFLLPAFHYPAPSRSFATTSPCLSKIGSAPLSIPPEVTFKVVPPPTRARGSRTQSMSTVHIKGPLGELSMDIPSYVNINQDPALSGPTLTVQDSRDAKQRAMWGMHASESLPTG